MGKVKAKQRSKARGQMRPFTREQVSTIRALLTARGAWRDLAMLNLAIDSMLRGGDLVRVMVDDVWTHGHGVKHELRFKQTKTGKIVVGYLSDDTRGSIHRHIEHARKLPGDYLFTRQDRRWGLHLSEVMLRLLVKSWASLAQLDPQYYSSHSLRRTKASIVYAETGNVEAVRQLLGHTSVAATSAYLGVGAKEVEDIARRVVV